MSTPKFWLEETEEERTAFIEILSDRLKASRADQQEPKATVSTCRTSKAHNAYTEDPTGKVVYLCPDPPLDSDGVAEDQGVDKSNHVRPENPISGTVDKYFCLNSCNCPQSHCQMNDVDIGETARGDLNFLGFDEDDIPMDDIPQRPHAKGAASCWREMTENLNEYAETMIQSLQRTKKELDKVVDSLEEMCKDGRDILDKLKRIRTAVEGQTAGLQASCCLVAAKEDCQNLITASDDKYKETG